MRGGRARRGWPVSQAYVDIAGPMPVVSVSGREFMYVVMDDHLARYIQGHCTSHQRQRGGRSIRVVAESESGKGVWEIMMDNTCKLSKGKMHNICEARWAKLYTTDPHDPVSNGVAE